MNRIQEHHIRRILVLIAVFFVLHIINLLFPGPFQWVDTRISTLFFHVRHFLQQDPITSPHLLLFSLDDTFEKKYDTPEKERIKIAEAIENIRTIGAMTIMVDIIFKKRDNTPSGNRELVRVVSESDNVFFPFTINENNSPVQEPPDFIINKAFWPIKVTKPGQPIKVDVGITSFPELNNAAGGLGGITLFPDSDGIIHRIPLLYSYFGVFIPSLVLTGICHYYNVRPDTISVAFGKHIMLPQATLPGGNIDDILIPVDIRGQLLVNFTGPWRESVTSFSLENLFIRDRYVLEVIGNISKQEILRKH